MFSPLRKPALTRSVLKRNIMSVNKAFILMFAFTFLQESIFALCVFAVTLLAPAGWIMHHIPDYRQRSPPQP
uniref:Uncharacterized protein n=1 Tax=Lates calcarifer TaxID=8187 RepID=A0A4W6FBW2_LATCA